MLSVHVCVCVCTYVSRIKTKTYIRVCKQHALSHKDRCNITHRQNLFRYSKSWHTMLAISYHQKSVCIISILLNSCRVEKAVPHFCCCMLRFIILPFFFICFFPPLFHQFCVLFFWSTQVCSDVFWNIRLLMIFWQVRDITTDDGVQVHVWWINDTVGAINSHKALHNSHLGMAALL